MKTKIKIGILRILFLTLFITSILNESFAQTVVSCGTEVTNYVTKWSNAGSRTICNSLIYDDGTYVGIGGPSPMSARLDVLYNPGTDGSDHIGIRGTAAGNHNTGGLVNYGGYFEALGSDYNNFGVRGYVQVTNSSTCRAGSFYANNLGSSCDVYGVSCTGQGGTGANTAGNVYGLYANVIVGNSNVGYGIYASGGNSCANNSCAFAAGYFSGDVAVSGEVYDASDMRLKQNIRPLSNATNILSRLNPVTYNFKTDEFPSMHLSNRNQIGFIAQEVEQILPELTKHFAEPSSKDDKGNIIYEQVDYLALNYEGIIPILVKGFQEQQAEIDELKTRLNSIAPENGSSGKINYSMLELKSENAFLYQNEPNPFDHSTIIRYYIPGNSTSARIIFMDEAGKTINEKALNEKGMGSLNVASEQLNSGIYTYSLEVDGKILDTKKMVCTK